MRACPRCQRLYVSARERCASDGTTLARSDDAVLGRSLQGYRLEARLGVGGTGAVYRATDLSRGAPCAVKILFFEIASDPSMVERFRREAEAVRQIGHENVVGVIGFGTTDDGPPFLAMELIEGPSLRTVIEREAPLDPVRALRLARQIAVGLEAAHSKGFVHRDLKPPNIMLTSNEGAETIKILDFGIVATLRLGEDSERLTKTGFIVGTPAYMAPEQIIPGALAPSMDLYALGSILFEMMTGHPPFTGSVEQILVAKSTQASPEVPIDGDIGRFVERLLANVPENRCQSAHEAVIGIDHLLERGSTLDTTKESTLLVSPPPPQDAPKEGSTITQRLLLPSDRHTESRREASTLDGDDLPTRLMSRLVALRPTTRSNGDGSDDDTGARDSGGGGARGAIAEGPVSATKRLSMRAMWTPLSAEDRSLRRISIALLFVSLVVIAASMAIALWLRTPETVYVPVRVPPAESGHE